jgi:hypothetical protein
MRLKVLCQLRVQAGSEFNLQVVASQTRDLKVELSTAPLSAQGALCQRRKRCAILTVFQPYQFFAFIGLF